MSNFNYNSNEEELTSPSSDEKMDTASDSFRNQDTPSSIRSSDFEDNHEIQNVLRLQNPEEELRTPEVFKNITAREDSATDNSNEERSTTVGSFTSQGSKKEVLRLSNPDEFDNLLNKMSSLNITKDIKDISSNADQKKSSLKVEDRPQNLGISPPKFSSTLTLTTQHPLMGLGSPDDYPDLIPKKIHKIEEKDLSLSSIEDERPSETNGFYSPQMNTSKNNLYFTENFVTADSFLLSTSLDQPPDVARVDDKKRIPEVTPQRGLLHNLGRDGLRVSSHSTPRSNLNETIEEFHSVGEWCDAEPRAAPDFQLPIEMSSGVNVRHDTASPDEVSSPDDRSTYRALLDPYTGSVALKQNAPRERASHQRRKILLPPEEDSSSLDSVSASSMESEDEPPEPEEGAERPRDDELHLSDDDTRRSKSTNTISYTSEPIPEYSLCEEISNERGWLSVRTHCAGTAHACDVKVIEPFRRVVSHGGYAAGGAALIVFSACHLPDNKRGDYTYVMDNLFLYVIWSLERLVTDEYILVYLHGSAGRRRLPACTWLHECYKLIDRRLRKSLKHLYLVHPTFWLKSFVLITKPFVSSKFFKKMSYIKDLDELMEQVPVDPNAIPDLVKQYDAARKR